MSLPTSSAVSPAASAAAAPPDDPPGVRVGIPRIVGDAVDVVVGLEIQQAKRHVGLAEDHRARRFQSLDDEIVALGDELECGTPQVVGSPATSNDSLIVIGTPCSGRTAARARALRSALPPSVARSQSSTTIAFSAGLCAWTRARKYSRHSTALELAACAVALRYAMRSGSTVTSSMLSPAPVDSAIYFATCKRCRHE